MGLRYALVDDHGTPLGFYETEEAAKKDVALLGEDADDLGIIEVMSPEPSAVRRAALRMLTRLSESDGYQ